MKQESQVKETGKGLRKIVKLYFMDFENVKNFLIGTKLYSPFFDEIHRGIYAVIQ